MANFKHKDDSVSLVDVCNRLDVLISLLIPPIVRDNDPPKGLQLEILKLCDYEHTTEDIQKTLNKTNKHINKDLSLLRSKGMIRTVPRDGKQVHVRIM
jgi:hypothetical protein